jgi:ubiquinone/menaquinone biosynthesis C-methylase UbiE
MNKLDIRTGYRGLVNRLRRRHTLDKAMHLAIGGEFEAFGIMEREILKQYGLQPQDYVIDVGCGSGRLAKPLSEFLHGPYLGIDIVPDLVDYARQLVGRLDWRFEVAAGLKIPERDGRAQMVCFFSVFTHLLHEQSYAYLKEARRVLAPRGRIVVSFLEFAIPSHWSVFDGMVADIGGQQQLNMFIGRDGLQAWAEHLGLEVVAIHDGDKPHIPLPHPVTLDNGTVVSGTGNLGQSVCVMRKP